MYEVYCGKAVSKSFKNSMKNAMSASAAADLASVSSLELDVIVLAAKLWLIKKLTRRIFLMREKEGANIIDTQYCQECCKWSVAGYRNHLIRNNTPEYDQVKQNNKE